jgi:sporulation protein YlmC with PRC-barrel domain
MKRAFWITVTSAIILSSVGLYVHAREETEQGYVPEEGKTTWQQPGQTGRLTLQSTLALINSEVKSSHATGAKEETPASSEKPAAQGQTLGKVQDVIFDNDIDAVYCVLVSANDKYYPVPWEAFGAGQVKQTSAPAEEGAAAYGAGEKEEAETRWGWLTREKGELWLNLSDEQFKQAPSIESVDMQRLSDRDLRQRVINYYSGQGLIQQSGRGILGRLYSRRPQANLFKASDAIDMHVENYAGKDFAEIEDLIIDVQHGSLGYAMVDYAGVMGVGEKTAAVPWSALSLDMDKDIALLDATEETLTVAVIEEGMVDRLSDREFARRIHQNFEAEPYWEVFAFVPAGTAEQWTAPWAPESTYNANFNPATMTTLEGTIRNVGSFRPQQNAALGLRLKVKPADGKSVIVYAGPRIFAVRQGMEFKPGDAITVNGSKTQVNGKSVIMASELTTAGQTLRLRDPQGKPLWKLGSMEGRPGMTGTEGM